MDAYAHMPGHCREVDSLRAASLKLEGYYPEPPPREFTASGLDSLFGSNREVLFVQRWFGGKALRQRGLYREAEAVLKIALRFSDNVVALGELGKVYLHLGKNGEALQFLARAAEKSPDNLERLCQLGDLHLQNLDTERAAGYFAQALAIDPQHAKASSGQSLVQIGDSTPFTLTEQ